MLSPDWNSKQVSQKPNTNYNTKFNELFLTHRDRFGFFIEHSNLDDGENESNAEASMRTQLSVSWSDGLIERSKMYRKLILAPKATLYQF